MWYRSGFRRIKEVWPRILCSRNLKEGVISYITGRVGEVDFVFSDYENQLTALNVSYTDIQAERGTNSLLEFMFGTKVKDLILLTEDTEKVEGGIRYVPLWKWILV